MARMGMDDESWERVSVYDVPVGTILIQEKMHWEYKTGMPADSTYIRVRVGEHKTVSGMMRHVEAEPSFSWPTIPPWQWIYPGPNESYWRSLNPALNVKVVPLPTNRR